MALAALSSLVNRRNPSWALDSGKLLTCGFVCVEGRQEHGERAAVPGTAALSGCCYFNPPARQWAKPEDQPVEDLANGPQILDPHQRSSALVLLASHELLASLDSHRPCLECHRVPGGRSDNFRGLPAISAPKGFSKCPYFSLNPGHSIREESYTGCLLAAVKTRAFERNAKEVNMGFLRNPKIGARLFSTERKINRENSAAGGSPGIPYQGLCRLQLRRLLEPFRWLL